MQFLDKKDCAEPHVFSNSDNVPSVLLFKDEECSNLPVKTVLRPEDNHQQTFVPALPGSRISFAVPDNDSNAVNESWPHIWVTDSYEQHQDLYTNIRSGGGVCQHFYKCQNFPGVCFATEDYVGRPIVYNVSRQGYYSYFLSDRNDCSTRGTHDDTAIVWDYNVTQYDIDAIRQKEYTPVRMNEQVNSIRLSGLFAFGRKSCALLDLPAKSVDALKFSCVKIRAKGPWDVAVLMCVLCVLLLICVLIGFYYHRYRYRRSNRQSENTRTA